ncbi:MAG: hypothetical protein Kow0090_18350 [Myxococcota bacterium]
MDTSLGIIAATAASIGFIHTVIGPDHYLPFVMIGRAQRWGYGKLIAVTVLCGLGHVLSSVILGFIGVALGIAVGELEGVEATRGEIASYLLIGLGLAYGVWGIYYALREKTHTHTHIHSDGSVHEHEHNHLSGHVHIHGDVERRNNVTLWMIFVIFVLGPCEPLIPLIMYPAAQHSPLGVALVSAIFGATTILTMTAIAIALYSGVKIINLGRLERYAHALAGFMIALSGSAIIFLGV